MKVAIEGNELVIRAEIAAQPSVSSTGKSLMLVNTGGFVQTGLSHQGKPVKVSLNAIVPSK